MCGHLTTLQIIFRGRAGSVIEWAHIYSYIRILPYSVLLKLNIFTVCEPKYVNMVHAWTPLNYRSSSVPESWSLCGSFGLPKTHKKFDTLSKFRPIIDTTNTPHYNVGKFLSNLLHPLTDYSLTDSFDAVTQINNIPKHLFREGYQFVSFDVVSHVVSTLSHSSDYFRSHLQRETHRY